MIYTYNFNRGRVIEQLPKLNEQNRPVTWAGEDKFKILSMIRLKFLQNGTTEEHPYWLASCWFELSYVIEKSERNVGDCKSIQILNKVNLQNRSQKLQQRNGRGSVGYQIFVRLQALTKRC